MLKSRMASVGHKRRSYRLHAECFEDRDAVDNADGAIVSHIQSPQTPRLFK